MEVEKVCVRIPTARKAELLELAASWRADAAADGHRAPGWDAKVIHEVASRRYGGLLGMFEHHEWPERGNRMMPTVQRHVREHYGSIEKFERDHQETGS